MSYLEIAKRAQAKLKLAQKDFPVPEQTADLTDGPIIAVEICSNVLEAHIWLAFDDSFEANDGQAVFYADELPFLATKDVGTLREIHKGKLAFEPASRVRQ
jgi:hypothetical protein